MQLTLTEQDGRALPKWVPEPARPTALALVGAYERVGRTKDALTRAREFYEGRPDRDEKVSMEVDNFNRAAEEFEDAMVASLAARLSLRAGR